MRESGSTGGGGYFPAPSNYGGGSASGGDPQLDKLDKNLGINGASAPTAGYGQIGLSSLVFTGVSGKRLDSPQGIHTVYTPQTKSVQELLNQFYSLWSEGRAGSIVSQLQAHGLIRSGASLDQVAQAYQGVLEMTAQFTRAGQQVTWQDVLSKWGMGGGAGGAGGGGIRRPSSYTTIQSQVNLTDPHQANQLFMSSLQDRLGRDPSAAEKQAFLSALHEYERENPSITSTHYKMNSAGEYDTTSKTTGGVDPNAFTNTYSSKHNNAEHGAYQAASTFMNALMQAVRATV